LTICDQITGSFNAPSATPNGLARSTITIFLRPLGKTKQRLASIAGKANAIPAASRAISTVHPLLIGSRHQINWRIVYSIKSRPPLKHEDRRSERGLFDKS